MNDKEEAEVPEHEPAPRNRHNDRNVVLKISKADLDKATEMADAAGELLKGDRFNFFREMLKTRKEEIEQAIINNRIHKKLETITITKLDGGSEQDTQVIEPEEQVSELAGQYKLINELLSSFAGMINTGQQIKEEVASGRRKVQE